MGKKTKKSKTIILSPTPKGKMNVRRFPTNTKPLAYHLCLDGLPELVFTGRLIGTASWPAMGFRKSRKTRAELDLYRFGKRYLAHIRKPAGLDEIYAGSSVAELLENLYDWSKAKGAIVRILGPTLHLNTPADFEKLIAITKRD